MVREFDRLVDRYGETETLGSEYDALRPGLLDGQL